MKNEKNITDQQYRNAAESMFGSDGSLEIDSNAKISRGEDAGAYVQAWVWVANSEVFS